MIKYMLHTKAFKQKPKIINAKSFKAVETTIDELIRSIELGRTIRPGVIKNNGSADKDWIHQELIFIDIDDYSIDHSIDVCNKLQITPLFIYKSFNHLENNKKHRVVFRLDTLATDPIKVGELISRLIDAFKGDTRCSNLSRIFFGTRTKAFNINKDATINIDVTLNKLKALEAQTPHGFNKETDVTFDKIEAKKVAQSKQYQCLQQFDENRLQLNSMFNNSCLIVNPNQKEAYSPVIPIDWSTFDTSNFVKLNDEIYVVSYSDLKDKLKQIPLDKVMNLPLNKSFKCIGHEDNNPSATIYVNEEGYYMYRCFSCNACFDIIDYVAMCYGIKGTKANKYQQAIDVIIENLHINITNSKWYKAQQQMIKDNRNILLRIDSYKDKYPLAYKKMLLNINLLNVMLNIAESVLDRLTLNDVDQHNILFSGSYRFLGNQIGKTHMTVLKRLDDLMLMNVIYKLSDEELSKLNNKLLESSKKLLENYNPGARTIQYYTMDTWTEETFIEAEKTLKRYKELGGVKLGASSQQFKAFGNNTRKKAKKTVSDDISIKKDIMITWAKRTVNRKKCFIKNDYLKYAKKNKIAEDLASSFIVEICNTFELTRFIVTKMDIKKYSLPQNALRKTAFKSKSF